MFPWKNVVMDSLVEKQRHDPLLERHWRHEPPENGLWRHDPLPEVMTHFMTSESPRNDVTKLCDVALDVTDVKNNLKMVSDVMTHFLTSWPTSDDVHDVRIT